MAERWVPQTDPNELPNGPRVIGMPDVTGSGVSGVDRGVRDMHILAV